MTGDRGAKAQRTPLTGVVRSAALVLLIALGSSLLLASGAGAKTFVADSSIPDTTAPSECTSPCSLRQAVEAAQAAEEAAFGEEAETVEVRPGTYFLTEGPLVLAHPFIGSTEHVETIVGLGSSASDVRITAGTNSRTIDDGNLGGTSGPVLLERVEITGGNGTGAGEAPSGVGGGIDVEQNGHLTLREDVVQGNTASVSGGGVDTSGGLVVERSTIDANTAGGKAPGKGGGIDNQAQHGDSVTVTNSTIAGNKVTGGAGEEGGGIFNSSTLSISSSTIDDNVSAKGGGLAGGANQLANSILAGNYGGACAGAAPTDGGGNIVGDATCELTSVSSRSNTDPLISHGPGYNGGPTPTTGFLSAASPAINAGTGVCPATDQRGAVRPGPGATTCDSGAVEYYPRFAVQGNVTEAATGTVTSSSSSPAASCSAGACSVDQGGAVTLTASVAPPYRFEGWTGGSCAAANPCVIANVKANETDHVIIGAPVSVSLGAPTGPVVHVNQGSSEYWSAQNGATIHLNGVINDNGVAASYTLSYTAQFGGCNGSYVNTVTLGPYPLPASEGNQAVSIPLSLTGQNAFPGNALISYTLTATDSSGFTATAHSGGNDIEVGPLGAHVSNYNPYATEPGSVLNTTPTSVALTASAYFVDQSWQYHKEINEPASPVTPAFSGSEEFSESEGHAYAIWLGFVNHGGLAFLGGAGEGNQAPEFGVFQMGTSSSYSSPGLLPSTDDVLVRCLSSSYTEEPQTVRSVATGLQPDTTYHWRFLQAFPEGVCPFTTEPTKDDCLDAHSGQPTWVPYLGSFTGNFGFPGSASPYAAAWNPIANADQTVTTAATTEPTETTVTLSTGTGTTQIHCVGRRAGCTGSFSLMQAPAKTAATKAKRSKPLVLATVQFKIAAKKTARVSFHLTSAGRRYLRSHRKAKVLEQVMARIGDGPRATWRKVIKLRLR